MSRSRRRTRQQTNSERHTEAEIDQIRDTVNSLYEVASDRPQDWEEYLQPARSTMATLDRLRYFRDPQRFDEQIWVIQGFQDYAFHDTESGAIQDIVDWCQGAWLSVLRNHPENVQSLSAQASVARSETPLYVEARGYLHPAVDFFDRAVRAADDRNATTGDLLSSAAEAHINMGIVSGSPADEQYFVSAILYLRRARALPGYHLAPHHEQYLNDYGRYVS
ncbi:hypothetical protein DH86_00000063 [Scytalidium sp. 3C]|nr:hypothetical protein DH86_00000063 [Scytalidium sp. 3C]